jgi:lactocepin
MKKFLGVFVIISIIISLLAGLAISSINASDTDPIVQQAKLARENYIKSNLKLPDKSTLPGKGIKAPTDGPIILEDVKNTELYKSGWIKVSIDADGAPLAEYAISKGKTTKNIDKNEAKAYVNTLKAAHSYLKNAVSANGIGMRNVKDMFIAYNGFSAEVQVQDLDKLFNTFGFNRVHVATLYKITDEYSNALIGADTVWTDPGVDGEGMYVGILDTGVDYTHPNLGGKPGIKFPTAKIPAGYDFGDLDANPMDCNSHGTHVAGIIAANGAVKGVAPEAKIVFAKIVEGCEGSAWDTTIAEAFDYMADPENLDEGPEGTHPPVVSINMSFGADSGFVDPYAPDQQAIENCISNGIVVSLSAGNGYDSYYNYGYYPFFPDYATIGSPAVTPNSIAVGASWNHMSRYPALTETTTNVNYVYTVGGDSPNPIDVLKKSAGYKYVYCGLGGSLGDFPSDVKNNIALIQRGGFNFSVKIHNAALAKAKGVIIFNHEDGGDSLINMNTAGETLPSVFIGHSAGVALLNLGSSGRVVFNKLYVDVPDPVNTMVDFSSWGPPPDLSFKPDITAPGGGIWSTIPVSMGSYANYSGTSMAAPHIAACAALLMEEHPDWTPKQVKIALMNTAELITDPMSGLPYSPHLMGAGRVNVYNALYNDVTLTDSSGNPYVALGDIPDYKTNPISFTLTLTNNDSSDITYNISATAQTTHFYLNSISLGNIVSTNLSGSITVPTGNTRTVVVTIDARGIVDWTGWPYLEGFIKFIPTSGSNVALHIPYMGFLGNWNDFNEVDWQFNPIMDPPADDPMNFATFWFSETYNTLVPVTWPETTDGTDWYSTGIDFNGELDRNAIAFNPNYYYLEADLWLLRNAENLNIYITGIKTIDTAYQLYKMGWYSYDPYTGKPWWWDGIDSSDTLVADGTYHLVYTATAPKQFDKGSFDPPQVIDFPVMVDTQDPTVTITGATNNGGGTATITWSILDPAPSSGIWGYAVVINSDFVNANWVPPTENSFNMPSGSLVQVFAFDNANNVGYAITTAP